VGGDVLRRAIQSSQITVPTMEFFDFGTMALKPVERAGLAHRPCLAVAGVVVAMSMADPPPCAENFAPQHGHKPRSWGKLLPGWYLGKAEDGSWRAFGPAAPETGVGLPAGCQADGEGFLIQP
jgi:hypothetical protein